MKSLAEMLRPLVAVVTADPARHANAWATHGSAQAVAQRLPLVHRTAKPGAEASWLDIVQHRRVAAQPACTPREHRAGVTRAAYFFLGCGAYPDGQVGFVLDRTALRGQPCSYTPLDSGSLESHTVPADPGQPWDDAAKDGFFAAHHAQGAEVHDFAGPYLAGHFQQPLQYVRCRQRSQPDFAPYHGLKDPQGDRRAFTIELQAHDDVAFGPSDVHLLEIVVAKPSLLDELPDDLVGKAWVAHAEGEVLEAIAERIEARITAEMS